MPSTVPALSDEESQAWSELRDDVPESAEDYLDITFEEEMQFIDEYRTLLLVRQHNST